MNVGGGGLEIIILVFFNIFFSLFNFFRPYIAAPPRPPGYAFMAASFSSEFSDHTTRVDKHFMRSPLRNTHITIGIFRWQTYRGFHKTYRKIIIKIKF